MSNDDMITIKFDDIETETDAAVLFKIDGETYWLPKSQIDYDEEEKEIDLPRWLAEKNDLEDYEI